MKTSVLHRVIAKLIDLSMVILVAALLPGILGPLTGFVYSLIGDGLRVGPFDCQSIGKKIMGLKVTSTLHARPIGFKESLVRNSPVGVSTFFAIIPVWGWVFLFLVGLPLMAIEIYLMVRVETGYRLGDVMADTAVQQIEEPFGFWKQR